MAHILSLFTAGRGATPADAARRRNLLAVSLASFLASVGFMVVVPLLPGLVREVVGADVASAGLWLGLAISVSPLLTALTGPFWGALGDHYGHKLMIQRSLLCIGVAIGLLALAASPLQVIGLRAVIGGLGGVSVAALAAVASITPRRELGPAIGTLQAAQMAGAVVGPLLGGVLGGLLGMRQAFLVSGGVFAAALVLVAWLYREGAVAVSEPAPRSTRDQQRATGRLEAGMIVALLAAFVVQFVEAGFVVLLPLQLERLGVDAESMPWMIGVGLSATALAAAVTGAFGGRLARDRSPIALLCGVLVLGILFLLPLAFAQTWWQFLGLRVLMALAVGAGPTLAYSAAAALAPPERRGKMVGLASSAGIFGWAASPLIAGALGQRDFGIVLALDAGLFAILLILLVAVERGWWISLALPRSGRPGLLALLPQGDGPRHLLGRLAHSTRPLRQGRLGGRFSRDEVIAALKGVETGPRAEAILEIAARPSDWLPPDPRRVFDEVPRYGERLPTILYLYRQGADAETIGRRLSLFGGAWGIERTIEIAARLIAARLNR